MDFTTLSISQIRELLKSRQATAVEITQAHLAQIEQKDNGSPRLPSACARSVALAQAKKVDAAIAAGEALPRWRVFLWRSRTSS